MIMIERKEKVQRWQMKLIKRARQIRVRAMDSSTSLEGEGDQEDSWYLEHFENPWSVVSYKTSNKVNMH